MADPAPPWAPVVVAMTGATGALYGIRLLEALRTLGVESHLIVSRWAETTIKTETARSLEEIRSLAAVVHEEDDLAARPARPDFATAGMVVAPCSMRTLAAVAHGLDDNLIQRAAAVHLAEARPLVLLVRETPLSVVHLENMLPPREREPSSRRPSLRSTPGSSRSTTWWITRLAATLDHLGIEHRLIRRWGEPRGGDGDPQAGTAS